MTKQQLQKELYRQKPMANLLSVSSDGLLYQCELIEGAAPVYFQVPLSEIGNTRWKHYEQAQLLIRYVVEPITAY